ncbi:MAG: hypothetical protein QNK23_02810 [Crocinitomicaceae bacterium]|nr:hypothetical protein [Crocinitomicaceae bacterium]
MKIVILAFFLFFCGCIFGQELPSKTQRKLRKTLKEMLEDDQEYRGALAADATLSFDSMMYLQTQNDLINREKFMNLIRNYGYPSYDRIGNGLSGVLTLHFTTENDFFVLMHLFNDELKKGNMPPVEFARWYDRCQINMHGENSFGEYGKKEFCADEIDIINLNRASVGLENLTPVACD